VLVAWSLLGVPVTCSGVGMIELVRSIVEHRWVVDEELYAGSDSPLLRGLPNSGPRQLDDERRFMQLAVDPAVSHSGFSFASRTTRPAMLRAVGGRPGLRCLLVSYLVAASLRYQASSGPG
jgi:hypothetical protein